MTVLFTFGRLDDDSDSYGNIATKYKMINPLKTKRRLLYLKT